MTRVYYLLFLIWVLLPAAVRAEEHTVERGETALQIAIDHNLTMEQLSQLNPGIALEMMLVGDKLTVPEEGVSYEDFLARQYGEMIRINGLDCEVLADRSALCLFSAENLTQLPLYDVRLRAKVQGENGAAGEAEGSIALMQILPGEKLPVCLNVPGNFDTAGNASVSVLNLSYSEALTSSFRIPAELYRQHLMILPDGAAATLTLEFEAEALSTYSGRQINVLAAAYDEEGNLAGLRSLYSDFYPRLDLTVYAYNRKIASVQVFPEVY